MNTTDICEALEQAIHVLHAPGELEVILENRDSIPERPYIVVQIVPTGRDDPTLEGTPALEIERGFMTCTIVSESGKWAKPARQIADTIRGLFPKGRRITVTGGNSICITKPAETLQGFPDGPDWRQPIRIDYEAN